MFRAEHEFDRARGRMARDLRTMISDGEDLLKAAASVSGEGFSFARAKFEKKLRSAGAALADASQPAYDRTRETAAIAVDYARGNPWTTAAGVAIAAAVWIGFLLRASADKR